MQRARKQNIGRRSARSLALPVDTAERAGLQEQGESRQTPGGRGRLLARPIAGRKARRAEGDGKGGGGQRSGVWGSAPVQARPSVRVCLSLAPAFPTERGATVNLICTFCPNLPRVMGTTGRGRGRLCRGGGGVDRISALPDELLLCILNSSLASVASKRPRARQRSAVVFGSGGLGRLDSRTLTRLASRRLAGEGELRLRIAPRWLRRFVQARELELPVCGRAAAIRVSISHFGLQPWVPAAGAFAALRVLRVACFDFRRLDLERVVSSQCPRLQELSLEGLMGSYGVAGLTVKYIYRSKVCLSKKRCL
ncbi:hypothetical protein C2845_PM05G21790 [Panicum miliaceum]|uniref:Uncharacterized protein n=1 Tax=Panicum miliaceum TaxID=4540 RepID=A0A3L6T2M0_PANMI|nr:hypothetical protein C2845_PM05G21790 [Panicum miliaceum]